jgi:hypothetical protein
MTLKFWPQKQLQMFTPKAEMFSGCLFKVLLHFEALVCLVRQYLMLPPGVIEMVHGRDAVLQAEAQAQMLQGCKDLVDDSHVSPNAKIRFRFFHISVGCFA